MGDGGGGGGGGGTDFRFCFICSSINQARQKSKLKEPFGFGYFKCHPLVETYISIFFEKFPTKINYKFPEEFYNSPMECDCQCNGSASDNTSVGFSIDLLLFIKVYFMCNCDNSKPNSKWFGRCL
jgi:hypothetical protein